uniref:hypothetical protein n=1 Tax=uncultured Microscilla sp. TaxID=432653 RepID=UPI0026170579
MGRLVFFAINFYDPFAFLLKLYGLLVNYNSGKPTQMKAEAYAQGNTVEIAPGKEKHLGHELAHIGQQAQGRVKPTIQANNGGVNINDDPKLEKEADVIGDKAMQMKGQQNQPISSSSIISSGSSPVLQGKFIGDLADKLPLDVVKLLKAAGYEGVSVMKIIKASKNPTDFATIEDLASALGLEKTQESTSVSKPKSPEVSVSKPKPVSKPSPKQDKVVSKPSPKKDKLVSKSSPVKKKDTPPPVKQGIPGVPKSFYQNKKTSLEYVTKDVLTALLPSYLPDVKDRQTVLDFWEMFETEDKTSFQSIPQLIAFALGNDKANKSKEYVSEQNAKSAPDPGTTGVSSSLERADGRNAQQIKLSNGFHGWGGSMSIDHARSWVINVWNKKKTSEKAGWLQDWKSETSSSSEQVPYVATGWTSQKGGTTYKISVPMKIGNPRVTPEVFFNAEDIMDATIICISGRDEVVFLTGIPWKYITAP